MTRKSPEQGIEKLIEDLGRRNQPISKWAAASLREIYLRDEFSLARIKGPRDPNLKYAPRAIRLIALQEGSFRGLGIVLSSSTNAETIALGKELRKEVTELPNLGPVDANMDNAVTGLLTENHKQTVAALEVSSAIRNNSKVVQVLYPKLLRHLMGDIFGSLGICLDELSEREAASVIAIKYLRSVPFLSPEPRMLTPENFSML